MGPTTTELLHTIIALPPGGGGEGGGGGFLSLFITAGLVFGIMYFLVIRPQVKKQKKHEEFLSSLKTGDEVVTQGGLFGRITEVDENVVTLNIGDRTKVKVLRSHVLSRQKAALEEEREDD